MEPTIHIKVTKVTGRHAQPTEDEVVREFPLTIFVGGEEVVTLLATPTHLDELVHGFLYTEGFIESLDDVASLELDEQSGEAHVELVGEMADAVDGSGPSDLAQHLFGRRAVGSGCGSLARSKEALYRAIDVLQLAKKRVVETAAASTAPPSAPPTGNVPARSELRYPFNDHSSMLALAHLLQTSGEIFLRTGGVHAAGLAMPLGFADSHAHAGEHHGFHSSQTHSYRGDQGETSIGGPNASTVSAVTPSISCSSTHEGLAEPEPRKAAGPEGNYAPVGHVNVIGSTLPAVSAAAERGMLCLREDIGRHNAVDKVIGWALGEARRRGVSPQELLAPTLILSTGRLSSEIVIKAARAGVSALLSRSAPTALAAEIAAQLGLGLGGFARGQRFTVYAG